MHLVADYNEKRKKWRIAVVINGSGLGRIDTRAFGIKKEWFESYTETLEAIAVIEKAFKVKQRR